jgi:ABC-2 type transport system ATP-binding protein
VPERGADVDGDAIVVRGLRKSYDGVPAVRGIDLSVGRGEVFALLGPNGAGKTTTIEILEGHRQRDAGEVSVLGHDPGRGERALKARLGIVLQDTGVEPYLTIEEVIDLHRGWYPRTRDLDEILEVVGLEHLRRRRASALSGGEQRRLDVALGLAGDPELLFLDEPTTGFDPSARRRAWDMVRNLQGLGKTIVLTSHYMDEVEHLADRVAVIAAGVIVADGAPSSLTGIVGLRRTRIAFSLPGRPLRALPVGLDGHGVTHEGGRVHVDTDRPTDALHVLTDWAVAAGIELDDLTVTQPSLEDAYLRLVEGPR